MKPKAIKGIALYCFFNIKAVRNNGKNINPSFLAKGNSEITIADKINLSLKNNQTAVIITNPKRGSVRAEGIMIKYIGAYNSISIDIYAALH